MKVYLIGLLLFIFSIVLPFWVILPFLLILLNSYLHLPVINDPFLKLIGSILILLGIITALYIFFLFKEYGSGTPSPLIPTQKFVIKGLYKYMRNPMYFGYMLIFLGEAFLIGRFLLFFYFLAAFFLLDLYVIKIEEPKLKKRFGKEYLEYYKKTPRWL